MHLSELEGDEVSPVTGEVDRADMLIQDVLPCKGMLDDRHTLVIHFSLDFIHM